MLTTTYNLANKAYACQESLHKAIEHYGGVKEYGADTPTPLIEIADICGVDDALWCLRCTQQPRKTRRLSRLLGADFAEHVLHFYEDKYPDDDRPRKAIEAARLFAQGKIKDAARDAARAAAWDAAGAAAWDAAKAAARAAAGAAAWAASWDAAGDAAGAAAWAASWDAAKAAARAAAGAAARAAAWDAAGDAERQWQLKRFKEVLEG